MIDLNKYINLHVVEKRDKFKWEWIVVASCGNKLILFSSDGIQSINKTCKPSELLEVKTVKYKRYVPLKGG